MYKLFLSFILLPIIAVYANTINCKDGLVSTKKTNALKWYRNSAEKIALYHQAFNTGLKYVINHKPKNTWGVILDIDETTLDNSWYFKNCSDDVSNEDDFSRYVALPEKSSALPGVKDFTCKIHALGGYVSLVSNRDGSYTYNKKNVLQATINNLKSEGICFDQVLLANRKDAINPSDKNPRFKAVINGKCDNKLMVCSNILPMHEVVAYFGDNIQDFPLLQQKNIINKSINSKIFQTFGNGFFILPNPIYGSWLNNTYK